MRKKNNKSRLIFVFIIFISIFIFYIFRIFYLQLFMAPYLLKLAEEQHNILLKLEPERGYIYDRNMHKLAIDWKVDSLYAAPNIIDNDKKDRTAESLSKILNVDKEKVVEKLKKNAFFVWIKRELDEETSNRIEKLELNGIGLIKEHKRFYPNPSLASHIIGFTGTDDVGLEGIELSYDNYLKGSPGWRWTIRDAKRRDILSKDMKHILPSNGLNIVLTIDEAIQHIAEMELEKAYERYKAKAASIIIMDPANGEILALANRPSFDIDRFSSASDDARRNRAVTDLYEPGSVFKIVTASGVIEKGLVEMEKEFFCEEGRYYIGGRILHDHRPYGILTFREIIEKSSNIGVAKTAQLLGKDELYRFIKLFGFGEPTGIDMPGEVRGIVRSPSEWSAVSISSVPIGQEIAVTSIQLVTAISAIANGGLLMKPRVVREIRDENGNRVKTFVPVVIRRVLSEESCQKMKDILTGVVERGTGVRATLDSYWACGKTGTAQKVGPDGSYSKTRFVASFMGFAPVEKPRIAILVSVDEPSPVHYGGTVAAPVFKNVASDVLRYLKVKPDKGQKVLEL